MDLRNHWTMKKTIFARHINAKEPGYYDADENLDNPIDENGISSIDNIQYPITMKDLGIDAESFAFAEEAAKYKSRDPPTKADHIEFDQ